MSDIWRIPNRQRGKHRTVPKSYLPLARRAAGRIVFRSPTCAACAFVWRRTDNKVLVEWSCPVPSSICNGFLLTSYLHKCSVCGQDRKKAAGRRDVGGKCLTHMFEEVIVKEVIFMYMCVCMSHHHSLLAANCVNNIQYCIKNDHLVFTFSHFLSAYPCLAILFLEIMFTYSHLKVVARSWS